MGYWVSVDVSHPVINLYKSYVVIYNFFKGFIHTYVELNNILDGFDERFYFS